MNEQISTLDPFEIPKFLQLTSKQRKDAWRRYDAEHGRFTEGLTTSRYKHEPISCFACARSYQYTGPDGDKSGRFCSDVCRNAYDEGFQSLESRQETARKPLGPWKMVAGPHGAIMPYGYDGTFKVGKEAIPYSQSMGKEGFIIKCAICDKEFDSKGFRCCSKDCERKLKRKLQKELIVVKPITMKQEEHEFMNNAETRKRLEPLADALNVSHRNIIFEAGKWAIAGRRGYVYADADYWYVLTAPETQRKWTAIKRKLVFMQPINDEFRMADMPTPDQAAIVRKVCGLTKRPALTEAERLARRERFKKNGAKQTDHVFPAATAA